VLVLRVSSLCPTPTKPSTMKPVALKSPARLHALVLELLNTTAALQRA